MLTVTVERNFSAAHRIEGHPRCGKLHGHNYRILVSFSGPIVDPGYVADFADLKELVDRVVMPADHRYIVSTDNMLAGDPYWAAAADRGDSFVPDIRASSAECLAQYFFGAIDRQVNIDSNVIVVKVVLYETPTGFAEVTRDAARPHYDTF